MISAHEHLPVLAVMGCFLGSFLVQIFGSKNKTVRNIIALTFVSFAFLSVVMLFKPIMIDGHIVAYWMGNREPVSGYAIGIGYELDSLNYFFSLLVVFTMLISTIYSFKYVGKEKNLGNYYTLFLLLSGGVLGMVMTGDIFNMFVMIEIMTFATVGLTAFRNGLDGALEAAFKYLVICSIGSGFILLGIAMLYRQCHTLNMAQLSSILNTTTTPTTVFAFAMLFAGLAVKAYIVPFHTPAADAYTTAPASVSMVLSGMGNKAGVYGIIRLMFVIFRAMDNSAIQIMLVVFGSVTMFIGVTMALAQHDFKRLLAFHSISQIGYVITAAGLGTAMGLNGALFHAMNHTLFKGLLFLCAGAVFTACGTVNLDKLGGLSRKMPKTTACFLIGAFSISGLPPFNGFSSKWQIYQAAYTKGAETGNFLFVIVTIVAVVVSVMTLASFIKVTQSVFFGQMTEPCKTAKEAPLSMRIPMWIMAALCVFTGVFYNVVNKYLLTPAIGGALNVRGYIDAMMGEGYAQAAGVGKTAVYSIDFNPWNPIVWLVLFVIIFASVFIVGITGLGRGNEAGSGTEMVDGKRATFFGGEKYSHSHVGGSDLFWGFRKNWGGYFKFMGNQHSGVVNDYALWVVAAAALVLIFMFIILILV
ncbi:MAG: proton-conducting transporter membrane subunit [Lachnospiraceae bacterium]|jgi:multicomponent Na+:H+ antiporter subunit D